MPGAMSDYSMHDPQAMRDASAIGRRWRNGVACAHPGGLCTCIGAMPAIDAALLERDFLESLATRYQAAGARDLLDAVTARQTQARFGKSMKFDAWIVRTAAALSPEARGLLLNDIETFLDSLVGRERSSRPMRAI